jgi:RNA polymerase sigma-70 factor (ECF subfamily)
VTEFEQFYADHERTAFAVAVRILHNGFDADDVVQESMLSAWKQWDTWRGEASRRNWMLQIVTNEARLKLRRDRSLKWSLCSRTRLETAETPEDTLIRQERRNAVALAFASLPPKYRDAWGRKGATARVHRWRAVQMLRASLI